MDVLGSVQPWDLARMGSSRVTQWRHTHKQTVTLTHRLLPLSQTSSGCLLWVCTPHSNRIHGWQKKQEHDCLSSVTVCLWVCLHCLTLLLSMRQLSIVCEGSGFRDTNEQFDWTQFTIRGDAWKSARANYLIE